MCSWFSHPLLTRVDPFKFTKGPTSEDPRLSFDLLSFVFTHEYPNTSAVSQKNGRLTHGTKQEGFDNNSDVIQSLPFNGTSNTGLDTALRRLSSQLGSEGLRLVLSSPCSLHGGQRHSIDSLIINKGEDQTWPENLSEI